jgi:hypothetical protein
MRQENRSRQRKLVLTLTVASCVVIIIAFVSFARNRGHKELPPANTAVVSQTVNLWDAGTNRGEQPGSPQSVSLPATMVRVTIMLPRFSAPGQYLVAVTRDQTGNGVLAEGSTAAIGNGDHEEVSVILDLRKAKGRAYFLSTTHEQDQASYYYPLQIK